MAWHHRSDFSQLNRACRGARKLMDANSQNLRAARQLLDFLQDLRASGVAQMPDCDLTQIVSETTAPRGGRRAASAASRTVSPTGPETPTAPNRAARPIATIDREQESAIPHQTARESAALKSQLLQGATPSPPPAPLSSSDDPPADLTAPPLATLEDGDDSTRGNRLAVLNDAVRHCTACPELVQNRSQTVFGVGTLRPRLCFFGEAPGADEDRQGEPFVGRAGQLLNKIIAAMTLTREEVYILNAIKCRPPGNRNPTLTETACCREFWVQQLEILRPEFICCLGGVAANTLFASNESVGKMRNRWLEYRGAKVMVTYHPAYLLRNEFAKRYAWADIQKLMDAMGLKRS